MAYTKNGVIIDLVKKRVGHGWEWLYIKYIPELIDMRTGKSIEIENLRLSVYTDPVESWQTELNDRRYALANEVLEKRIKEYEDGHLRRISSDFITFYKHEATGNTTNYTASLYHFSNFMNGKCDFDSINVDLFNEYVTYLECNASTSDGEFLANSTVKLYASQFKNICKRAARKGYLDIDTVAGFVVPKYAYETTVADIKEVRKLYKCKDRDPVVEKLLSIMMLTYIPVKYLLTMKYEDVMQDQYGSWYIKFPGSSINDCYISNEVYELIHTRKKGAFVLNGISYVHAKNLLFQWVKNAGFKKPRTFSFFRIQIDSMTEVCSKKK